MNKYLLIALAVLGAGSAEAQDTIPNLGAAANYADFGIGNTQMTISSGNTRVTGNVAVGAGGSLDFSGGGIISGLFLDPNAMAKLTGNSSAAVQQTASLALAAQDAINASMTAANDPITAMLSGISGSSSLTATQPVTVYRVNGDINLQGGSVMTISGSANSHIIVDVTGGLTFGGGSSMNLVGGITANNVIFNFIGSGKDINFNGNSTVDGTFLAINRNITDSGGIVNGRLIGAENGQLKLQSGPKVNQPVPEPVTALVLAPGLLLLRRRKRAK